jgi:hypothetical protein
MEIYHPIICDQCGRIKQDYSPSMCSGDVRAGEAIKVICVECQDKIKATKEESRKNVG